MNVPIRSATAAATATRALALALVLSLAGPAAAAPGAPASGPDAPAGHRWVLNEAFSDEFDGDTLDRSKWNDVFPGWKGRPPGLFLPENVSVADGFLQIRSVPLDPPREDGKWTIGCGAIQSVTQVAPYGYHETRVKASSVSTSTTFWLKRRAEAGEDPRKSTELDIMEAIGNAQRFAGFATQMRSNTHLNYPDLLGDDGKPLNLKAGANTVLPGGARVDGGFHTYGCWWVDATTMHFFLDGEHVHTIEVSTEVEPEPMNKPMFLNAVCETYAWEHPPHRENLLDASKNTTRYDWIRSWTLEKIEAD
ncbi:family 16 glycosylhydrolase [Phycisphaera mikurensis]|uniref:Putative beta-agarase n=1 Tax=Phycisphaera mikurensis (strain NBRC 102666 / KCTC 22515 / FYK2301M01) TaxID=1142394 RepID=I0IF84_PHYMF|nr:family 16 glycosylhydrolase [Phycisphaera mikurensis]MBB6440682.1 hypothetical protein [Phycisphaera mikurensis]BAM03922.1 putative beta-agarase [Phycisphaera mikurensis NBRC 102666]